MKLWRVGRRNPLVISITVLVSILLFFLLLDLIYGFALIVTNDYFYRFGFLNLLAPTSGRVNTLSYGVYTNLNLASFGALLLQWLRCLDFEFVIILFLLAGVYYLGAQTGDDFPFNQQARSALFYYFLAYILTVIVTSVAVILNLIPLQELEVFVWRLGVIALVSSIVKLALLGYFGVMLAQCIYAYLLPKIPVDRSN